MPSYFHTT